MSRPLSNQFTANSDEYFERVLREGSKFTYKHYQAYEVLKAS
jgi:hypothetical protein